MPRSSIIGMALLVPGIIWAQGPDPVTSVAAVPSPVLVPAPFAFADFTWLNGGGRQKDVVLDTKYFTGEFNRRGVNVPYFAGSGGVTPPGGNQGTPGSVVQDWVPDLRKLESRLTFALLVKF